MGGVKEIAVDSDLGWIPWIRIFLVVVHIGTGYRHTDAMPFIDDERGGVKI
jgi:hypothetical protein